MFKKLALISMLIFSAYSFPGISGELQEPNPNDVQQITKELIAKMINAVTPTSAKLRIKLSKRGSERVTVKDMKFSLTSILTKSINQQVIYNKDNQELNTFVDIGPANSVIKATFSGADNTDGLISFVDKRDRITPITISVTIADTVVTKLQLYSIKMEMSGLFAESTTPLTVQASCNLKQELISLDGKKRNLEDTVCDYDMTYNRVTKEVDFDFLFDSTQEDGE